MSPKFKKALQILGWDQYQAAENLGKGLRTINRYANGGPVPLLVERELQRLITAQHKAKQAARLAR
jgi:hypothetical protein